MKTGLDQSFGLNQLQLEDIRHLETLCNQFEGLTMKLNWSRLQRRPTDKVNDFLYYQDDKLVGYLALYNFNQKEAEVSAMTHPDYRQRAIFKQLLAAARAELKKRGVPDFLFICERTSVSALHCMQAIKAGYDFSEYKMLLQGSFEPKGELIDLELRPATPADIPDLAQMDESFFNVPAEVGQGHLAEEMADINRRTLIAIAGGAKIGKIGIRTGQAETFIYGFGVLPPYRRKGYGRSILTHSVRQLIAEGWPNISLEVATGNERALSLYQQAGFQTTLIYDYYRLPVGK